MNTSPPSKESKTSEQEVIGWPSPAETGVWQEAAVFAARAHRGQTTPGTIDPYFSHPARVAMLVSVNFGSSEPAILATAYLHDVLEKSSVTSSELQRSFGSQITDWVEWLSKNHKKSRGEYWKRLEQAPWQARLIKLADVLDHLNGPIGYRADRVKSAKKALKLARSDEPEITRAAALLTAALTESPFA
jgi:(p)ppGpp synthase/HD superfamily hydrolase